MFHNDYINAVREYLYRYHEFSQYIANVRADLAECRSLMNQDAAPASPSFSPTGGCGGGEKESQQERIYARHEELQHKIDRYSAELDRLGPIMARLDRSLEALGKISVADKAILVDRYIDKASWESTARHVNASVGYCRKRAGVALETLTVMMFGRNAIPKHQGNMVFFKEP